MKAVAMATSKAEPDLLNQLSAGQLEIKTRTSVPYYKAKYC